MHNWQSPNHSCIIRATSRITNCPLVHCLLHFSAIDVVAGIQLSCPLRSRNGYHHLVCDTHPPSRHRRPWTKPKGRLSPCAENRASLRTSAPFPRWGSRNIVQGAEACLERVGHCDRRHRFRRHVILSSISGRGSRLPESAATRSSRPSCLPHFQPAAASARLWVWA